ncbi:ribosomal L7Ae/L30e/S12e/Gadd45 family protein [Alicyclobacillus acidocaldarius]|uniref:ribosomal L7Ae/L30e/S12e/Gadd45 family protein n=1 Tax=Alicyclobacillus acidocaldarius TaxID=405212 RepID=UPI0002DA48F5|nr:ribosomal L7Ae/L30e/S12e/Gadd45 family protein [Alicyclobacillus acidocaldarius]
MSLDDIRQAKKKTVGTNQTLKALRQPSGRVVCVYVAKDAEPRVTEPVVQLASKLGVSIEWVDTMRQLGEACGIEVGAASACILAE